MSSLRKPAVGPIVGHTTANSCRLWIAAGDSGLTVEGMQESVRTIGVIGVFDEKRQIVSPEHVYYFRLKREYDRTGSFNLGKDISLWEDEKDKGTAFKLKPDTQYRVRFSTISLDDSFDEEMTVPSEYLAARLPEPGVWAEALTKRDDLYVEACFKTQKAATRRGDKLPVSFLLGSCRYPGIMWKKKESDRIFGPMLRDHEDVNFVMMVGDQIYADLMSRYVPIGRADTYMEFRDRYRSAFSSPNMQELLSNLPVYMTLDDHEIEDNWTQDRIRSSEKRELFNLAIGFYMSYQWSHGPRFADSYVHQRKMSGVDKFLLHETTSRLFYDFNCQGYPFFVLDTRTQRYKDEEPGLADNHMLGRPGLHVCEPNQVDYLCAWLRHMQEDLGNVPKFIATSSVFTPNTVSSTISDRNKACSDSWEAYPETRGQILQTIVEHGVQNAVFLSGDIHCANMSQMTFSKNPELVAYSVTSSAFYWPFPFADGSPADYVHDSRHARTPDTFAIPGDCGVMDYTAWGFSQADNFCRINVRPDRNALEVQFFGTNGAPLSTAKRDNKLNSKPDMLVLAEW